MAIEADNGSSARKKEANVMRSLKLAAQMTAVVAILGAMILGITGPYERAMSSLIDGYGKTRLKAQSAAAADSKRMTMTLGRLCAAFMQYISYVWPLRPLRTSEAHPRRGRVPRRPGTFAGAKDCKRSER